MDVVVPRAPLLKTFRNRHCVNPLSLVHTATQNKYSYSVTRRTLLPDSLPLHAYVLNE